ncbi:MAG: hypothetical protein WD750_00390 [Gammaproteobacteria bacterium]
MHLRPFKRLLLIALLLPWAYTVPVTAVVTGKILPDETFAEADTSSLKAEARVFLRIKDGVMLTLAECEITDTCAPSVGIREVERILETIDVRITTLMERYTETSNEELEEALLIYADAREGYADALQQLEALTGPEDDDTLGDDAFIDDMESGDYSDLFEDADDDL